MFLVFDIRQMVRMGLPLVPNELLTESGGHAERVVTIGGLLYVVSQLTSLLRILGNGFPQCRNIWAMLEDRPR